MTIDWSDLVLKLIPSFLRKQKTIDFLNAAIEPIKELYVFFEQYQTQIDYKLQFYNQVISLEHLLNDMLDYYMRRVYIETPEGLKVNYIYQAIEERPKLYIEATWLNWYNYTIGMRVAYEGNIFEAIADNMGVVPAASPSEWQLVPEASIYIHQKSEVSATKSFIVWMPTTYHTGTNYLVGSRMLKDNNYYQCRVANIGAFNPSEWIECNYLITDVINRYREAGMSYELKTF